MCERVDRKDSDSSQTTQSPVITVVSYLYPIWCISWQKSCAVRPVLFVDDIRDFGSIPALNLHKRHLIVVQIYVALTETMVTSWT